MPKRRTISTKLTNEIRELNKKLSKKKSNIRQRHGIEVDLPRIDVNANASERRKQINEVKRFLNRSNQNYQYVKNANGVSFTKKEVNEAKRLIARANRIKKAEQKRIGEMDFIIDGKSYGKIKDVKTAQHLMNEFRPLQFNLDLYTSRDSFLKNIGKKKELYSGNFIKKQRLQYQENYISALKEAFGNTSDIQPLIQHIKNMNPHEFYITTQTEAGKEIVDVYDEIDRDTKLEGLLIEWGLKPRIRRR